MSMTREEALEMFANGPTQLCMDVHPDDWTDAYRAELAEGGTSKVNVNGLEMTVVVARIDDDLRRVWFTLVGAESAVAAEVLSATMWGQ